MPRFTNRTTTLRNVTSDFNLLADFTSDSGEYDYSSSGDLIFWPNICAANAKAAPYGTDRSTSGFSVLKTDPRSTERIFNRSDSFCGDVCSAFISATENIAAGGGGGSGVFSSTTGFYLSDDDALSFGNGATDSAFSISLWYYSANPLGNQGNGYFFIKENEYAAYTKDDRVYFQLTDNSEGKGITVVTNALLLNANAWDNLVFVYDGSGLKTGMFIYLNGVDVTNRLVVFDPPGYVAMENTASNLYFTNNNAQSGTSLARGEITEIAMWSSALSSEEILSIYNATLTCTVNIVTYPDRDSGYINLSPRVLTRIFDNATGSYPTLLRTGDRDRRGNYSVRFNDTIVQNYGEKIFDNFSNSGLGSETVLNASKWESYSGASIQKEVVFESSGNISESRVLVFRNPGDSEGRWIKTKNKVRNPIVRYSLLQGPIASEGLGYSLSAGATTDVLKVQASTDGTTWVDIKTYVPSKNLSGFYNNLNTDGASQVEKRRRREKLGFADFNFPNESFYIRWIQDSISSNSKAVWAISEIEIESMNQDIRYPLLLNHDTEHGKKADRDFIATPHTRSDLSGTGRSVKGISDSMLRFTPGEDIGPFDETYAIEAASTNDFFRAGTSPAVISGYSQPPRDKTKIVFNLNPDPEFADIEFGYITRTSTNNPDNETNDTFTNERLMVYWHEDNKRWSLHNFFNPLIDTASSLGAYLEDTSLNSAGFGSITPIATASINDGDIVEQFGRNVLASCVRPIKTFGFPFAKDYALDDSKCIKMSNYISHPFLLEKIVVDFKASFEFAAGPNGDANFSNSLMYSTNNIVSGYPSQRINDGHRVSIPTFFILNQRKDQFKLSHTVRRSFSANTNVLAPVERTIASGTISETTTRDLVSYGQMTMFASSSSGAKLNIEDALENGLSRDLDVNILELNGQSGWDTTQTLSSFTGSFSLKFPCRVSPKYDSNQQVVIKETGPIERALFVNDDHGGRGYSIIDCNNRSPVNGNTSLKLGDKYLGPGPFRGSNPVSVKTVDPDTIDQVSPYVLFPEDRIIFGWQYPLIEDMIKKIPGLDDSRLNSMSLLGESRVYFYGSLIKENFETHNTINQNLTSDSVHEYIGAEKVLDQYQVNARSEFSGSYIDDVNYFGLGYVAYPFDSYDLLGGYNQGATNPITRVDQTIKYRVGSVTNIRNYLDNVGRVVPIQYATTFTTPYTSLFRGLNIRGEKTIADSNKSENSFWFDYGTVQNYKNVPKIDNALNKKQKYYFNYRHFGYSSDMMEQGKDTRFGVGFPSSVSIESPVKIDFVTSSIDPGALASKSFLKIVASQIRSNASAQSSNLSTYATSSLPFFDNGIAYN